MAFLFIRIVNNLKANWFDGTRDFLVIIFVLLDKLLVANNVDW